MRTPLVVLTGVDPLAVDQALLGLSWDLPRAVVVRHRIDPASRVLTRVVSDASGVVEEGRTELEHACPTCALREDVLPTLERVSDAGRWESVVACLPTGAEAVQLSTLVTRDPRLARRLRLAGVLTVLGATGLVDDLLGGDRLRERGWHTGPDDDRGVGEVACAQVELADVVMLDETPVAPAGDLVRALARPDAEVLTGSGALVGERLLSSHHGYAEARAWSRPVRRTAAPPPRGDVWQVELRSERPFHPGRLVDQLERLAAGGHRSRGCFWLPTRPGQVQEWAGAGGHLSIGAYGAWNHQRPLTHLLLTCVGTPPTGLGDTFESLLVPSAELASRPRWRVLEDGLESWLGEIREVA